MEERELLRKIENTKKEIDYYSKVYSPKSVKVKKLKAKLKTLLNQLK